MTSKEEFEAQARALTKLYIQSLPAKRQAIKTAWDNLQRDGFNNQGASTLAQLAHNLAGSGGLYGLQELSGTAMNIEILLSAAIADGDISPTANSRLSVLLDKLDQDLLDTVEVPRSTP